MLVYIPYRKCTMVKKRWMGLIFLVCFFYEISSFRLQHQRSWRLQLKIRKEMMVCVFYDSLILCVSEFEKIGFFWSFLDLSVHQCTLVFNVLCVFTPRKKQWFSYCTVFENRLKISHYSIHHIYYNMNLLVFPPKISI